MRGRIGWIAAIGVMAALAGCAGTTGRLDTERRLTAVEKADLNDDVRNAILGGRVLVGMSEGMVAASWGLPHSVRASTDGGHEWWSYGSRFTPGWETTLVFHGGTLVDVRSTRVQGVTDLWDRSVEMRSADPHSVARPERSTLAVRGCCRSPPAGGPASRR
jgi:hypothetical protein